MAKTKEFLGPKRYITGLTMTNNVSDSNNDIDIAAGECVDTTGVYLMILATGLTKRLDANWTAGNNGGGLDTGSKANSTSYYVFLIRNLTTGAVDALFSASATSPTMPVGYTVSRRIGIILTNGSGNLNQFSQTGNRYSWKTGFDTDIVVGTSSTLCTMTGLPAIEVEAQGIASISGIPNATGVALQVASAGATTQSAPEVYVFSSAGFIARRGHAYGSHIAGDYSTAGHGAFSEFRAIAVSSQIRIVANSGTPTARIHILGFTDINL